MTDKGMQEDPMTPLAERAVRLHEFYNALLAAGFNPEQALELVMEFMKSEDE